jgi:hypothetical protein
MASQLNVVRKAVQTAWEARLVVDTITGVDVRLFHPMDEYPKTDAAYLHNTTSYQEYQTMGYISERLEVSGRVTTFKAGVGDTSADAAETRALAILASLEAALDADSTLGGAVTNIRLEQYVSDLDVGGDGIYCDLKFTLVAMLSL